MSGEPSRWIASRWERLSTGLKMLLILSLGLLPLGIIAVFASIEGARENRTRSEVEAQALLAVHAQRYTLALSRNNYTMRATRDALLESQNPDGICARALERLARLPVREGRYALFGVNPVPHCVTPGFALPRIPPSRDQAGRALLDPASDRIIIFLFDAGGGIEGIAEFRRAILAEVVNTPAVGGDFALELVQGDRLMPLRAMRTDRGGTRQVVAEFPFIGGDYSLRIRLAAAPISVSEALAILTPVLMWLWASLVGWMLVQRLLLGPLSRIQRSVSNYQPGDRALDLAGIKGPAKEIESLRDAFERQIQTVAHHEDELEAAVERQKRLVREVHHRVKNNLQVVASLLNLHSRGSKSEDVAAAYASIQRRVDALAVVHRNHFAELEESRGVALRPLVSELASNLRATAPASALGMQIRVDIAAVHVSQDVAVSIAFLVTEISEFGMLCGATGISIVIETEGPASARLSIEIGDLVGEPPCDPALADRLDRIVTGLVRQLRSTLERDPERGRYALSIAIVGTATESFTA